MMNRNSPEYEGAETRLDICDFPSIQRRCESIMLHLVTRRYLSERHLHQAKARLIRYLRAAPGEQLNPPGLPGEC